MTTTTETEPTETAEEEIASTEPEPEIRPLTLTEFIATQLCSRHLLDSRYVVMTATADGTRIDIDIEHPFPQERHIRVVAHLEVVVPDEADDVEQAGAEIGASV